MLIDLHAHSSGISTCCRIAAPEVLKTAKENGIDGIVLTNHYTKMYLKNGMTPADFAKKYVEEYRYAKKCGDECGVHVFFGIEVTMEKYGGAHLLIYGVGEDFTEKYPDMYDFTQEELFTKVHQSGGIFVQAHPFRNGGHLLDTDFLDGVEINCHPLYKKSFAEDLIEIAARENIILTCGGDYHADTYRPKCGAYIPDEISDGVAVGAYLKDNFNLKLCIQEPCEDEIYDLDVAGIYRK